MKVVMGMAMTMALAMASPATTGGDDDAGMPDRR